MAANDTAALVVALSAQLTQYEKDLDTAYNMADRGVSRIESRFRSTNIKVAGLDELADKITKLATAAGLAEAASKIVDLNQQIAKVAEGAQLVGLTTDEFQRFRFAVVSVGGSVEQADGFLDIFSRKISEAATGTGALYNFLRVNNVALRDANGQLLPLSTLLAKYADLVKNTASPQERINELVLVGGRNAGNLADAFKGGADGLKQFGDQADQAGVIIDKALVQRAKEANDQFQVMKLRATTVFEEAALAVVETFQKKNAEMNKIGQGWADALKNAWSDAVAFIEANNPDAARIIANLKQAIENATVTGVPLTGRSAAHDVTSPLTGSKSDERFLKAPVDVGGDNTTKQFNEQAEAFEKLIKAQNQRIALLGAEQQSVGTTIGFETTLKTQIELENQARQQNIPLTAERLEKIRQEAEATGKAAQALDDYKKQWLGINSAAQFAGDQLIDVMDGLRNKTLSAADAARQLANNLIHALEQAVLLGSGPLAGVLGTQSNVSGGTGGLIGQLLGAFGGSTFSGGGIGHAAGGGSFGAGDWSVVGENGPELVRFGSNAQVIPNNIAMGGGGVTNNFVVENHTDAQISQNARRNSSGGVDHRVIIKDVVKQGTAGGDFDSVNRARLGIRPRKVF